MLAPSSDVSYGPKDPFVGAPQREADAIGTFGMGPSIAGRVAVAAAVRMKGDGVVFGTKSHDFGHISIFIERGSSRHGSECPLTLNAQAGTVGRDATVENYAVTTGVPPTSDTTPSGLVPRRPGPDQRLPLLWRAFFASALIMVAAAAALAVTPVTIHAPIALEQLAIVLGGLVLMLLANLWVLGRVLAPLRTLTTLMSKIDPDQPGQRITGIGSYGPDVAALSDAFNGMLDRLEHERHESARVALDAQEGERQRLAAELHDEIGQTLTAAAIQIEHAGDSGHDSPADLRRIADAVRGSLDEVRRIARELRPEALDDLGLINALISLCSRLTSQGDLRIERQLEKLPPIAPGLELVITGWRRRA